MKSLNTFVSIYHQDMKLLDWYTGAFSTVYPLNSFVSFIMFDCFITLLLISWLIPAYISSYIGDNEELGINNFDFRHGFLTWRFIYFKSFLELGFSLCFLMYLKYYSVVVLSMIMLFFMICLVSHSKYSNYKNILLVKNIMDA